MHADIRPTSPHLTIYRWQITMVLSILHRMTGLALFAGTALMVAWLCTAAYAPGRYMELHEYVVSPLGQILLCGWTAAFYFHFANGIRHLFWDMGKGFELGTATLTGWLVLLFTLAMTCVTWGFIYALIGV